MADDQSAERAGQYLADTLKQNVVVDNRAGGNSVIGSELAAHAAPDGHTLLVQINNLTALPVLPPDRKSPVSRGRGADRAHHRAVGCQGRLRIFAAH